MPNTREGCSIEKFFVEKFDEIVDHDFQLSLLSFFRRFLAGVDEMLEILYEELLVSGESLSRVKKPLEHFEVGLMLDEFTQ